jgi:hypothetical protein
MLPIFCTLKASCLLVFAFFRQRKDGRRREAVGRNVLVWMCLLVVVVFD